jgi:hypothetical protein
VILQVSAGVATNRDEELNDIYRKTQQYVNRFNTMNNPEKEHQEVVDELDNLQEYVYCYLIFLLLIICVLVGIISLNISLYFCSIVILHVFFKKQCLNNIPCRNRRSS